MDQIAEAQPESAPANLTRVAENLWIHEAAPLDIAGVPLPLRMTVIRLKNGDLILHAPTEFSESLRDELKSLGTIKYLLAPSYGHWMFLANWQNLVPHTITLSVPGLLSRAPVRASGLRIDREIADGPPEQWAGEVETVLLAAPLFVELALFHRQSRTLILTDLVQNLDPAKLPVGGRVAARLLDILKPNGRAPLYVRALLRNGGRAVRQAAARLVAFAPERVIFAHGEWFAENATERLRKSLNWLLPAPRVRSGAPLRVVITGASSGIGRAAAFAFASRGARLTLAARREAPLQRLAEECQGLGAEAQAVPTDVTDAEAMERLAEKAEQAFGGIDVWINNAGTGVFGAFRDADMSLHRKTLEVNLLGAMNGAFAVLPTFLRQNHGILINNISLGGWAPTPFAAAYTASKFGLRGFTASLRQELSDHPNIHVCGVFPAMVDTPGFGHGANMSGKNLDPGPFLYQPEDVAETFVRLARHPRDETAVGWPARAGQLGYILARAPTERILAAIFRTLLARARGASRGAGGMIEPVSVGTETSGGWLARKNLPSARQLNKLGLIAGLSILFAGIAMRNRRKG